MPTDEEVRIAILEERLDNHLEWAKAMDDRNDAKHDLILARLEEAMEFQRRLRWVGGTILLLTGAAFGWVVTHANWLWNILPMHKHTH